MAVTARIDELRRKYEQNPRRYFAPLANEYRKAGDLESAIVICRRELAAYPEHISGHIVLGQALYEAGRRGEARTVFEAALGLDPENLIALRHLGDIARAEGDDASARRWYGRILEADPRNDDIAALLATVAAEHGVGARGGAAPAAPATAAGFGDALGDAMQRQAPAADEGFVGGWDLPAFETPPAAGPGIPVVSGPISEPPGPSVLPHLGPEDEDQYLDDLVEDFLPPGASRAAPAAAPDDPSAPGSDVAAATASAERADSAAGSAGTVPQTAPEAAPELAEGFVSDFASDFAPEVMVGTPETAAEPAAPVGGRVDEPQVDEPRVDEPRAETAAEPTFEAPGWLEAVPEIADHPELLDEALEPVVGLDVAPVADSAQVQLGAAELDGVELPAAELWAAELGAAEPELEQARAAAAELEAGAGALAGEAVEDDEDELPPWEEPPEVAPSAEAEASARAASDEFAFGFAEVPHETALGAVSAALSDDGSDIAHELVPDVRQPPHGGAHEAGHEAEHEPALPPTEAVAHGPEHEPAGEPAFFPWAAEPTAERSAEPSAAETAGPSVAVAAEQGAEAVAESGAEAMAEPAAEPTGAPTAESAFEPAGEPAHAVAAEPSEEPVDVLDLDPALIEAAPPGAVADAAGEPRPASAAPASHDDAHVDASELSALTSGAFATETLAELFVQQGHLDQAVAIYERLVAERPGEPALERRLREVRRMAAGEAPEPEDIPEVVSEAGPEIEPPHAAALEAVQEPEPEPRAETRPEAERAAEHGDLRVDAPEQVLQAAHALPAQRAREFFAALASRSAAGFGPPTPPVPAKPATPAASTPPTAPAASVSAAISVAPAAEARGTPAAAQRAVEPLPAPALPAPEQAPHAEPRPEPEPRRHPEPAAALLAGPASEADERAAHALARGYAWTDGAAPSVLDDLAAVAAAAPPAPAPAPQPVPPPAPAAGDAEPSPDDLSFDRFFAGFEDLLGDRPEPAAVGEEEQPLVVAAPEPGAEQPASAGAAAERERPAETPDDDLAQFNAWLKGLGDL